MPSIYSDTVDGYILNGLHSSWATARGGGTGSTVTDNVARNIVITYSFFTPRGGGRYGVYRSFFQFDTSEFSVAPSSATLKIFGFGLTTGDIIAVRS